MRLIKRQGFDSRDKVKQNERSCQLLLVTMMLVAKQGQQQMKS